MKRRMGRIVKLENQYKSMRNIYTLQYAQNYNRLFQHHIL